MGGRAISREKGWFENQLRAKITRDKRWIIGGGRGKFKYVPFTADGGRGEGRVESSGGSSLTSALIR